MDLSNNYQEIVAVLLALTYVLAIPSALEAILNARTAQGAIAWAISLITLSPIAVPLYLIFGRNRFEGYLEQRDFVEALSRRLLPRSSAAAETHALSASPNTPLYTSLVKLARVPLTHGNKVELLIDGQATFDSIAAGLQRAQRYILFQFYIIRDDKLGRRLGDMLIERAGAGVAVFLLYDELGSRAFEHSALHRKLVRAGINVAPFNSTRGRRNRFQLNFRNHRKIVVVDGRDAWIGGHNVGDEYLGRDPKIGPLRDTHAYFCGPAVHSAELTFAIDWHWATRSSLGLPWTAESGAEGPSNVLVFPSNPASEYEEAGLMYHQVIVAARERIWIASPYFVPDNAIVSALQLAALRGVDVRILIPDKTDGFVVGLANWSFTQQLLPLGIKIYRYREGFMHQKVFLMDDQIAGVGTANFDNRSFRLNFEVTVLVEDADFALQVQTMLENDMDRCRQVSQQELQEKPPGFTLATAIARLFAPLL